MQPVALQAAAAIHRLASCQTPCKTVIGSQTEIDAKTLFMPLLMSRPDAIGVPNE